MKTRTKGLSKFRATCLKLVEFVVIITERGKPIARMLRLEPATLGVRSELCTTMETEV